MIYGIDVLNSEVRWVRNSKGDEPTTFGRVFVEDSSPSGLKQTLRGLFTRLQIRKFVFPLQGRDVKVKCFASDKVDISELEDNVAWEARFFLGFDKSRDIMSFDPLRSVGQETWVVAAKALFEDVKRQSEVFPISPVHTETGQTAIANAVLESKWGQNAVMTLHLDTTRAFLVVVSHGIPILAQELFMDKPFSGQFDEVSFTMWQEELKLRRNFLLPDHRKLDAFLLSGEAGLNQENAKRLGESIDLDGSVFEPFEGKDTDSGTNVSPLYSIAYACSLRDEP
ncbi:hypothetical protein GX441_07005 [bacterium]|nr:hypothetical protein [bacterium]